MPERTKKCENKSLVNFFVLSGIGTLRILSIIFNHQVN